MSQLSLTSILYMNDDLICHFPIFKYAISSWILFWYYLNLFRIVASHIYSPTVFTCFLLPIDYFECVISSYSMCLRPLNMHSFIISSRPCFWVYDIPMGFGFDLCLFVLLFIRLWVFLGHLPVLLASSAQISPALLEACKKASPAQLNGSLCSLSPSCNYHINHRIKQRAFICYADSLL